MSASGNMWGRGRLRNDVVKYVSNWPSNFSDTFTGIGVRYSLHAGHVTFLYLSANLTCWALAIWASVYQLWLVDCRNASCLSVCKLWWQFLPLSRLYLRSHFGSLLLLCNWIERWYPYHYCSLIVGVSGSTSSLTCESMSNLMCESMSRSSSFFNLFIIALILFLLNLYVAISSRALKLLLWSGRRHRI
jgi:hypothetical protein